MFYQTCLIYNHQAVNIFFPFFTVKIKNCETKSWEEYYVIQKHSKSSIFFILDDLPHGRSWTTKGWLLLVSPRKNDSLKSIPRKIEIHNL